VSEMPCGACGMMRMRSDSLAAADRTGSATGKGWRHTAAG
jgi:hypothetical protein